jgi:hypothetical protein
MSVGLRQWNHHWYDTGSWKWVPWTASNCMRHRWLRKWVAVTRTCVSQTLGSIRLLLSEVDLVMTELVFQYRRWLVDQLLLGFAHIVYTVKGKRVTSEYWIVSRVSVRWSSTSTIRTLMAWRFNIPQKSFLCERLSIPSLEWFVFYMQMAISTTGRRPLCILCSVSVLSKMLKLRSAEGSSFRLWWMLSDSCCWGGICFACELLQPFVAEAVRRMLSALLRQHHGALCWWSQMFVLNLRHCARHQTHWVLGSVGLVSRSWSLQQCWVFWGEACQMVNLQWLEPSASVFRRLR